MGFIRELRPEALSGEITVSFRLRRRPNVKAGNRYLVGDSQIEVDSVNLIPFAAIDEADLPRSGEADLETMLAGTPESEIDDLVASFTEMATRLEQHRHQMRG